VYEAVLDVGYDAVNMERVRRIIAGEDDVSSG